ncbi:MAG: histidinol-phosphate transaminase [Gammaproteobacteria bacterium]|nr:histidinol-phosphate transaminase [Gammaproteobacteria bacterium]
MKMEAVVCDAVAHLTPYLPGKPIETLQRELGLTEIIKLASNENPLGASPLAQNALTTALTELHRYPDGSGFLLRQALAGKFNLQAGQITLGNGSNDVLDLIARTFLTTGCNAVFSEQAFAIYPIVTQAVGAQARVAKAYPADHAMPYGHDLDALLAQVDEKTRLIFIANPNNPTGTWFERPALLDFLQAVPEQVVVVLDEAYTEYVEDDNFPDGLALLAQFPNLIVSRTFSKIYGLAGLRCGYAASSAEIADYLNRIRQPFNVNSLALAAATAALGDDDFVQRSAEHNRLGLKQLRDGVRALALSGLPSVANFITVDLNQVAQPVFAALLKKGVIVRPVANYGLPNHLRISVGLPEENRRCLAALAEVLA